MTALADMTDCELIREGSFYIMKIRNAGQPLDQMLSAFQAGDLRAVTLRAYEHPRGSVTALDFAADEMERCTSTPR